ncbi:hypothetical protein [Mesorhizobium sp.]|uniref:hypothetical protein n=1 Tax=Mesorhizobium sp. TaxID=1871066 RepID=UPI0025EB9227|nr:hypothetical protein [Mesorhizobium sp.]
MAHLLILPAPANPHDAGCASAVQVFHVRPELHVELNCRSSALPLIALPGISPRKRGERGWPQCRRPSCERVIGEIVREGGFLPVTIRGEMPGRAMRGGANAREGNFKPEAIALKNGINQMDGPLGLG